VAGTLGFALFEVVEVYEWVTNAERRNVILRPGYGRMYVLIRPLTGLAVGAIVTALEPSLGWKALLLGFTLPGSAGGLWHPLRKSVSGDWGTTGGDRVDDVSEANSRWPVSRLLLGHFGVFSLVTTCAGSSALRSAELIILPLRSTDE
jgi:hypothetical protein